MTRILMVCLGNICRSPLAEGILRSMVNEEHIVIDSAGTAGYHVGNPPDARSIAVAKKHGIDISQQSCRKFLPSDFDDFDIIYVMDKSNFNDILVQARNQNDKEKLKLLLEEAFLEEKEVPDPYYGGNDGFENIFKMISIACQAIAKKYS